MFLETANENYNSLPPYGGKFNNKNKKPLLFIYLFI